MKTRINKLSVIIVSLCIMLSFCLTANAANIDHTKCFARINIDVNSSRWELIEYEDFVAVIDLDSLRKENKYIPFKDRIFGTWFAWCLNQNHHDWKTPSMQYLTFNIDKRTYKRNNKWYRITPNTFYEGLLQVAIDKY